MKAGVVVFQGDLVWLGSGNGDFHPVFCQSSFEAGNAASFKGDDGVVKSAEAKDTKNMEPVDVQVLDHNIDNIIQLNELTERGIVHNLRIRFEKDMMYTNVCSLTF